MGDRYGFLWLLVSQDEYELPLAVADSATELARMVGTTQNNISSTITHQAERGAKSKYIKVKVIDD